MQANLKVRVLISSILAFCLAVYPPIQAALLGGVSAITSLFAADAFYYLSIPRNSTVGWSEFDGVRATNGFHPLWEIVLQIVVVTLQVKTGLQPMVASFALSVAAVGIGLSWLAGGLTRLTKAIWPVLLLFPGTYFLIVAMIDPRFGSPWSFMNGMESPFSILFFGILFFFLVGGRDLHKRANLLILSLLSLAVLLSRLDDVFLVGTLGIWLLLNQRKKFGWSGALGRIGFFAVPVGIGLLGYLAFNLKSVGVLLPTSGMAKSSGLALIKNVGWLVTVFAPFTSSFLHRVSRTFNQTLGISLAWRFAQMLLPMAVAAFLLKRRDLLNWIAQGESPTFAMLLSYVLVKGSYNLLFVPIWNQGHWYFPLSILIVDVTLALAVARFVQEQALRGARFRGLFLSRY